MKNNFDSAVRDFRSLPYPKVWLVGAGAHARSYSDVLLDLGVDFTVIGRGEEKAAEFREKTGLEVVEGGLEKFLKENPLDQTRKPVAIVSVSVTALAQCAVALLEHGIDEILLEKPGGIDHQEIEKICSFAEKARGDQRGVRIRLAYNRRFYSSVQKAVELAEANGGITSFTFEFTEWSHRIADLKVSDEVKRAWFFGNSTHVIDLAFYLGGDPVELSHHSSGGGILPWHPNASVWVGSGISSKNALFSYHANWAAPGRWGIEIMTRNNRYILRPLEKLQVTPLGSVKVEEVEIDDTLDKKFKPGLWLQTKTFLENPDDNRFLKLEQQLSRFQRIYQQMRGDDSPPTKPTIFVIGAGNVGSRHLQAMSQLDFPANIYVVDPSSDSIERARKIFNSEKPICSSSTVNYRHSIEDKLPAGLNVDVCIVATTSTVRRRVVEGLVDRFRIKHMILEKVLFQSPEDHHYVDRLLEKKQVQAFVNCLTMTQSFFRDIKNIFDHQGPVNVHVKGNGWGLCCNALHLLAISIYLNGTNNVELDGSSLEPGYEESKRKGFVEVNGTLKGSVKVNGRNADITLICDPGYNGKDDRVIKFWTDETTIIWDIASGDVDVSSSCVDVKGKVVEKFTEILVSRWSHRMVSQLIKEGTCDLPSYKKMLPISIRMIEIFTKHLSDFGHPVAKAGLCPIT